VYLTEAVLTFEDDIYTMHVVGPRYHQHNHDFSVELLKASYLNCLHLAYKEDIKSIAFPLISAGGKGFPKAIAFETAKETIDMFLAEYTNIDVTLVVYEDSMYEVAKKYIEKVSDYIEDTYIEDDLEEEMDEAFDFDDEEEDLLDVDTLYHDDTESKIESNLSIPPKSYKPHSSETLYRYVYQHESILEDSLDDIKVSETFARYLSIWLDRKGIKDSDFYKKIYMSKQTFNKIINGKTEKPNQKTAMLIAYGLELNLDEAMDFLSIIGYTFSRSSKLDLIVKYFIQDKNYDLNQLETTLYELTGQTLATY
jgi:transcriptional regulator with XRE-family HTH domain